MSNLTNFIVIEVRQEIGTKSVSNCSSHEIVELELLLYIFFIVDISSIPQYTYLVISLDR